MKDKFIKAMWWDVKNDKPHACLIEGNKETVINLGYFYEDYNLTEKGKEAFEIWKSRNK